LRSGTNRTPSYDGEVASVGLVILVLDEDSRIKTDYMFPG
jgi:hypothetical protein